MLPDSPDGHTARILAMPAELLPTVGLGEYYLASSPIRDLGQCHFATRILSGIITRHFGLPAAVVPVQLQIGNKLYGSPTPKIIPGSHMDGHLAIIANDQFLDPTAAQYAEIRSDGGVRVVSGPIPPGQSSRALRDGAVMLLNTAGGSRVTYTAYPSAGIEPLWNQWDEMDPRAPTEISNLQDHVALGYRWLISQSPSLAHKVAALPAHYRVFQDSVAQLAGKHVDINKRGKYEIID